MSTFAIACSVSTSSFPDAGCTDCGGGEGTGEGDAGGADASTDDRLAWPNAESQATSDRWIAEHHDEIEVMRPRIMVLNFVNAKTSDQMVADVEKIFAAIREATRYHGYEDEAAEPFIEPQIAYAVDLRDDQPPPGWDYRNSTLYPREQPKEGYWSFDYEALFTEEFAGHYGIEDPDQPGRYLSLCELSERGLVHEVWVYGDADVPDVSAAEILAITPRYDADGRRLDQPMDRCAGNGCFDEEDLIPPDCTRTLRIGWINNTRGPGCFLESIGHGIESFARGGTKPYLQRYFRELAGFDLDDRYGLPFDSWYACPYGVGCLSYPSPRTVSYSTNASTGTIEPYVPVCGNAHFPPNGRSHYDITNSEPVDSTCRDYRQGSNGGSDQIEPVSAEDWSSYAGLAPDCTGAFAVWWWQNFPGHESPAIDGDGAPMKNWWPFFYY